MKYWFGRKYKWIATVTIVVIICTSCGKEQDGQKKVASDLSIGYLYDSTNNRAQISDSRISKLWEMLKEQSEKADDTETIKVDEESADYNGEISHIEKNQEDEWDVDFEVVTEGYIYHEGRNEIDIYYPQLSGFADSAKEDRINALIEEDVKKIIGEKNKEGDDTLYCISLDYEIKFLNERIISVLYEGMYGYIMSGHGLDAKAVATTIDIEEEKIITLKDVVTNFTELSDMLLEDEFENISMWDGTTEGFEASIAVRIRGEGLDVDLQERHQEWYTKGDSFIIILDSKRADYNEYSISIESVRHILDAEFLKKLE